MKKKKEFFRIRKSKKRKNGANARVCTCVSTITDFFRTNKRERSPRPFARFQIREKRTTEKNPSTVFEPKDKPTDRKTLV